MSETSASFQSAMLLYTSAVIDTVPLPPARSTLYDGVQQAPVAMYWTSKGAFAPSKRQTDMPRATPRESPSSERTLTTADSGTATMDPLSSLTLSAFADLGLGGS